MELSNLKLKGAAGGEAEGEAEDGAVNLDRRGSPNPLSRKMKLMRLKAAKLNKAFRKVKSLRNRRRLNQKTKKKTRRFCSARRRSALTRQ